MRHFKVDPVLKMYKTFDKQAKSMSIQNHLITLPLPLRHYFFQRPPTLLTSNILIFPPMSLTLLLNND